MEPVQPAEFEVLVRKLRKQPVLEWTEETAKHAAVVPILGILGWDPVKMQFELKVGSTRNRGLVDIKLTVGRHSVLVECKKPRVDLDQAVGQLFEYAFHEGARLAVLTNGMRWDLYLPYDAKGSARERRFASIGLQSREDPADLFAELRRFLERDAVKAGKAVRNAKERLKAKQRGDQVKDALPVVWKGLLNNPPEKLIELIENGVQRRIGHTPKSHQVRDFLSKRGELASPPMPSEPMTPGKQRGARPRAAMTESRAKAQGRKISAFVLWGQRTEVNKWANLLFEVAVKVYQRHQNDFTRVTNEIPWIARNNSNMLSPRLIPNSPYYINVHGGAPGLETRSRRLLEIFGYPRSSLEIIRHSNTMPTPSAPPMRYERRELTDRRYTSTDKKSPRPISAFVLWGQRTAVTTWIELLIGVSAIMYQRHGNNLDNVTNQVSWLSRSSADMNAPHKVHKVPGSPYYVNAYAGAKVLEARCRRLLKFFGHSPDDLQIVE